MSDADTKPLTIVERMKEAAYEQSRERQAEWSRVAEIVLGKAISRREYLGEVVKLGEDFVVEVEHHGSEPSWTTVVGGKKSTWHQRTQEEAVLYLIARRYDANDNSHLHAAFYAGRVLGVPDSDA